MCIYCVWRFLFVPGHTGVVQLLLDAGADANQLSHSGASSLYWPTQNRDEEMVSLLTNAGGIYAE
jgi:ankyrin repeat protein